MTRLGRATRIVIRDPSGNVREVVTAPSSSSGGGSSRRGGGGSSGSSKISAEPRPTPKSGENQKDYINRLKEWSAKTGKDANFTDERGKTIKVTPSGEVSGSAVKQKTASEIVKEKVLRGGSLTVSEKRLAQQKATELNNKLTKLRKGTPEFKRTVREINSYGYAPEIPKEGYKARSEKLESLRKEREERLMDITGYGPQYGVYDYGAQISRMATSEERQQLREMQPFSPATSQLYTPADPAKVFLKTTPFGSDIVGFEERKVNIGRKQTSKGNVFFKELLLGMGSIFGKVDRMGNTFVPGGMAPPISEEKSGTFTGRYFSELGRQLASPVVGFGKIARYSFDIGTKNIRQPFSEFLLRRGGRQILSMNAFSSFRAVEKTTRIRRGILYDPDIQSFGFVAALGALGGAGRFGKIAVEGVVGGFAGYTGYEFLQTRTPESLAAFTIAAGGSLLLSSKRIPLRLVTEKVGPYRTFGIDYGVRGKGQPILNIRSSQIAQVTKLTPKGEIPVSAIEAAKLPFRTQVRAGIEFGTPKRIVGTYDYAAFEQPRTGAGTRVFQENIQSIVTDPTQMLIEGRTVSPQLQQEFAVKGVGALREVSTRKSQFYTREDLLSEGTKYLSGEEAGALFKGIGEKGGRVFGSYASRAELKPSLKRVPGDIEGMFATSSEAELMAITEFQLGKLRSISGRQFRIQPESPFHIEANIMGQWQKVAEFKGRGIGEGDIAPERAFGLDLWSKNDFRVREGTMAAMLRGETKRKAAAAIGVREGNALGVAHTGRFKDVPDYFRHVETLAEGRYSPKSREFLKLKEQLGIKYGDEAVRFEIMEKRYSRLSSSLEKFYSYSSVSPRIQRSLFPSVSPSPSPGFSMGLFPSPSGKASPSIFPSVSPSPSVDFSMSLFPSPSLSPSIFPSPPLFPSPSLRPSPSPSPSPFPDLPPPTSPKFDYFFRELRMGVGTEGRRTGKRKYQYIPTVFSAIRNIAAPPQKTLTGLGIRPLLKRLRL